MTHTAQPDELRYRAHGARATAGRGAPRARRGITLIEMLIAMALTLVLMAAVVNVFDQIGESVAGSRATMEMSDRIRGTRNMLQGDLEGVTVPLQPWVRPGGGTGYFEYVEGPYDDVDSTGLSLAAATSLVPLAAAAGGAPLSPMSGLGDYDDVIAFTTRSVGVAFQGRGGPEGIIESPMAEVVWYCVENPADGSLGEPGMRTLYRRILLIAPWLDMTAAPANNTFYNSYDVSARIVNGSVVANTLADASKRENRFARVGNFPYAMDTSAIHPVNTGSASAMTPFTAPDRLGQDVVLSNVLAFDVRAYDPDAPLRNSGGNVVTPGDPGWAAGTGMAGRGAYVDLNYVGETLATTYAHPSRLSAFSGLPSFFDTDGSKTKNGAEAWGGLSLPTYDTWPFHYEHDGDDQDNDGQVDEGTDGFDTLNAAGKYVGGVDDMGERETLPPYPVPLRGLQVRIRVYEPDSRQIREVSVVQSFVPE